MIGVGDRVRNEAQTFKTAIEQALFDLRVACPGIIQDFDPARQVATIKLTIREDMLKRVGASGTIPLFNRQATEIPLLVNVPVVFPRAGGYTLTCPVAQGDECLVIFADMCFDAWWQSGGIQNQIERRRHDLSDGFAIMGPWSQPRVLPNFSQSSAQLRNDAGDTYVEVIDGQVTVKGNLQCTNGASGSFTSQDGTVVTVQGGIITNLD